MTPKNVEIVYTYPKNDRDCSGDYESGAIYFDGYQVFRAGDYYHDKTEKQIEGFIEACRLLIPNFPEPKETNTSTKYKPTKVRGAGKQWNIPEYLK